MENSQHQQIIKSNIEILEHFPHKNMSASVNNEDKVCTIH